MPDRSKRGLLVWGGLLMCSGLGVFAFGQVSLLRRASRLRAGKATVACRQGTTPATARSVGGTKPATSRQREGSVHATSPPGGGNAARQPVLGLDAGARRSLPAGSRSSRGLHHRSRRAVMPPRKVRLSRRLKSWLRRQAKRRLPPGWLYVITGYATERSSRGKNLRLAKARADAVRRYLVTRLGVPAHRIRIRRSVRLHRKGSMVSRRGVRVCVGRDEECR